MAGGNPFEVFNAGAYNTTKYAKQGDLGSVVLKPRPTGTVWKRGAIAKTRWQMTARHGGGYQYRVCPTNRPLTEACFQENPLEFASPEKHRVLFSSSSVEIPAMLVVDGPAKGWMRMPVPNSDTHPCDYNVTEGHHCPTCGSPGCRAPWWAADSACPTPCAAKFPGLPLDVSADPSAFPDPIPNHDFHSYAIEDELKVPDNLPAGEYVLGWRWDCEMTSQVWSTCADITIE